MIRLAAALMAPLAALSLPALAGGSPLPFDLGGEFALVDQYGEARTQADPDGKPQLLFFGYANCREICSAALPMMAQVADAVAAKGIEVTPVMITVDPTRDTVDTLGPAMALHHPDFVGLTGDAQALQVAYDAYQIETEEVFFDPEYGPVYAHGSFMYLLDGDGALLTLLPPVISPEAAAGIVETYTGPAS